MSAKNDQQVSSDAKSNVSSLPNIQIIPLTSRFSQLGLRSTPKRNISKNKIPRIRQSNIGQDKRSQNGMVTTDSKSDYIQIIPLNYSSTTFTSNNKEEAFYPVSNRKRTSKTSTATTSPKSPTKQTEKRKRNKTPRSLASADKALSNFSFKPRAVSFRQQLAALVIRNIKIKRRQFLRTLAEFCIPIFFSFNLILQRPKFRIVPQTFEPVVDTFTYNPNFDYLIGKDWVIINQILNRNEMIRFVSLLNGTKLSKYRNPITFHTRFKNRNQFYSYFKEHTDKKFVLISLDSFQNNTFHYTISMERIFLPPKLIDKPEECTFKSITQMPDRTQMENQCSGFLYYQFGFTTLQALLDSTILKLYYADYSDPVPDMKLGLFPQPSRLVMSRGNIRWVISSMTSCLAPFMAMIPSIIVQEKESKVKPAMMMMGVKSLSYFSSWFIVHAAMTMFSCFIFSTVVFLLGLTFNLNPLTFYLLIQLYALSVTAFAMFMSIFFQTTRTSYVFTGMVGIMTTSIFFLCDHLDVSMTIRRILTLFPPLAYAFTLKYCMFSMSNASMFSFTEFTLGYGIFMLLFDTILYMFLAVTLDHVITYREYIWRTYFEHKTELKNLVDVTDTKKVDVEPTDELSDRKIIKIREVTKIYDQTNIAVNNVSMDIFDSQITAFLGQNGAGKTTLVNMISGLTPPTSGRITICGREVHDLIDLAKLQTKFGVCLQENILTEDLSPLEHLQFYATIKGASGRHRKREIYHLLKQTELFDHKDKRSRLLSGGQKRKLCVAIALVGGSQIIFLDEPTSGVDPYSRQKIWTLLQAYKQNRVIILTTHVMYEADILCERKAILVKGVMRVLGSSLFLKNKYGIGYHLRLDIDPEKIDKSKVMEMVMRQVPGSRFQRQAKSELLFTLPRSETYRFPKLFRQIDQMIANKQGILGYGINLTTLEDVFLKITYDHDIKHQEHRSNIEEKNVAIDYVDYRTKNWQIFQEFFKIRFKLIKRNWTMFASVALQILWLLIFLVISEVFANMKGQLVTFNSHLYPDSLVLYSSNATRFNVSGMVKILSKFLPTRHVNHLNLNTLKNRNMALQFIETDIHSHFHQNQASLQLALIFNKTYTNALPLLQNAVTNMLIQSGVILEKPKKEFAIALKSYPLPDRFIGVIASKITGYSFVFIFSMILISFPATLALDTIVDRQTSIKNFLNINGMRSLEYWVVTGLVHSLIFGALIIMVMTLVILITKASFMSSFDSKLAFSIFIILYVPTSLSLLYVATHLFNRKELAQSIITLSSIYVTMGIFFVALYGAQFLKIPWLQRAIYFIWPLTTAYGFLMALIQIDMKKELEPHYSPFAWEENITPAYVALIIYFSISMFLLPLFDHMKSENESITDIFSSNPSFQPNEEPEDGYEYIDEDVAREIFRVKQLVLLWKQNPEADSDQKKPLLLLDDLTKKYRTKTVVKRLNAIVECGQIFGLLGPNGAGKTTVMKIIAREEAKTSGRIFINGLEVKRRLKRDFFSYCPQINPFWPEVTLMEHLKLYATIRGVPRHQLDDVCNKLVKNFGIEKFKDFKFKKLSGGNQRKLCLLIAILGNARMTLLDEPSSGMDPNSKRLMWDLLLRNFEPDGPKSAILTSHAMEEVEALCSRLAILAEGSMKCVGNIQHLNNKFGKGYILEIKTKQNFQFATIESVLKKLFPNLRVTELALNRIKMTIPQENVKSLADFFETMEDLKKKHPEIVEYGLTQSSIEQIFIEFAKIQENQNQIQNPNL